MSEGQNVATPRHVIMTCRQALPEQIAGIYFLIHADRIVYVGQTRNGIRRVFQHMFGKTFDSYAFIPAAEEELDELEAANILQHAPEYNRQLPTNGRYKTKKGIGEELGLAGREVNRRIKQRGLLPHCACGKEFYVLEHIR